MIHNSIDSVEELKLFVYREMYSVPKVSELEIENVFVQALVEVIALCSWARNLTFRVFFTTHQLFWLLTVIELLSQIRNRCVCKGVLKLQSCVHSVGSDTIQGFHQSLYSCLCALQEEEWELFQFTLDNAKYVITK